MVSRERSPGSARSLRRVWIGVFVGLCVGGAAARAEDSWTQFRGPNGSGHAQATGLPLTWSETEHIAWKTPVHDFGWSSPVIWDQQVWVTTATADGKRLFAVGLDRQSGKIVHDVPVFAVAQPEHIASVNTYASPTPVIEAGRVYVHYGTYGTACLDTQTGAILWTRRDLNCDHHEGPGASPILFENLLIFHVDGRDVQYAVALDKRTGQTVWKTNRSNDYTNLPPNLRKCFATPIVIDVGGRPQLFSPAAKGVFGYDPRTGEELWKIRHYGWSIAPRPVMGHGLVFFVNDYERTEFWAIRPDGRGDVTASHVAWKITHSVPAQPSPLLIGDLLYLVNNHGILSCVEAQTGQVAWRNRLPGDYSASPIYADGRLYFVNHDGVASILAPGREFKTLGTARLDGTVMATPAVGGRALFVRTKTHLYRIEQ